MKFITSIVGTLVVMTFAVFLFKIGIWDMLILGLADIIRYCHDPVDIKWLAIGIGKVVFFEAPLGIAVVGMYFLIPPLWKD